MWRSAASFAWEAEAELAAEGELGADCLFPADDITELGFPDFHDFGGPGLGDAVMGDGDFLKSASMEYFLVPLSLWSWRPGMSRRDFSLAPSRIARRSKTLVRFRHPSLLDSFRLSSWPRKSFSIVVSLKLSITGIRTHRLVIDSSGKFAFRCFDQGGCLVTSIP